MEPEREDQQNDWDILLAGECTRTGGRSSYPAVRAALPRTLLEYEKFDSPRVSSSQPIFEIGNSRAQPS